MCRIESICWFDQIITGNFPHYLPKCNQFRTSCPEINFLFIIHPSSLVSVALAICAHAKFPMSPIASQCTVTRFSLLRNPKGRSALHILYKSDHRNSLSSLPRFHLPSSLPPSFIRRTLPCLSIARKKAKIVSAIEQENRSRFCWKLERHPREPEPTYIYFTSLKVCWPPNTSPTRRWFCSLCVFVDANALFGSCLGGWKQRQRRSPETDLLKISPAPPFLWLIRWVEWLLCCLTLSLSLSLSRLRNIEGLRNG